MFLASEGVNIEYIQKKYGKMKNETSVVSELENMLASR